MVLRDTIVYQTGDGIYVEDGNFSVGYRNLINDSTFSAFIGNKNSGDISAVNSLAVGKENQILSDNSLAFNQFSKAMSDNSIAMGTHGETWIDDQISIGGFEDIKTGAAGFSYRNAHGQESIVPLKFHGVSDGYQSIRSFEIPQNKTIQYSAELLFTKQKGTGVASFVVTTGIVKNYGYRDPERAYQAYKKTIIGIDNPDIAIDQYYNTTAIHNSRTIYNNSQERIYALQLTANKNDLETGKTTTFEVTAPPHQYEDLNIEAEANPIIVKPISDHSTKLYATKGYTAFNPEETWYNPYATTYRSGHLIKLSPFNQYPYNTGAPINLGQNIDNITECVYFRKSGEKETYIKFHEHGISPFCPLDKTSIIGSNETELKIYKDSNFNFCIPQESEGFVVKQLVAVPTSGRVYRSYLPKNIIGGVSGTGTFHVYQVTGIPTGYYVPTLSDEDYKDDEWVSNNYGICEFYFRTDNLAPTDRNWSEIDNHRYDFSITKTSGPWSDLGLDVQGYINPQLGYADFVLSKSPFFAGPNLVVSNVSQIARYYPDDLSFSGCYHPFKYVKTINDTFKYVDRNTISFTENQLGYIDDDALRLVTYPHQFEKRLGFNHNISNQHLDLKVNDSVEINGVVSRVTQINKAPANNEEITYTLDTNYNISAITDVFLVNPISGVGFSDYRSFATYTGTYTFVDTDNTTYSTKFDLRQELPLVIDDEDLPLQDQRMVPTGTGFVFMLPGPYYDSNQLFNISGYSMISNYNSVAISSVSITSNGSNNFELKNLQLLDLIETADPNVSGIYAKHLDFRANNIRIFGINEDTINLIYPGYSGPLTERHHIYMSDPPVVFVSGGLDEGDYVSYKYLTSNDSNNEELLANSLTVDPADPSFGEANMKLTRFSNWFLTDMLWHGYVENTGTDLRFDFAPENIEVLDSSPFFSNSGTFYSGVIATGSVVFTLSQPEQWADRSIYFGRSTCDIVAVQNHNYSDYGKVLTFNNIGSPNIGNELVNTKIYEVFNINIYANYPKNTGIYAMHIYGNQPYQRLDIDFGEYSELLRVLSDEESPKLHNNFNISFNISDTVSGMFSPENYTNKFINQDPNYKPIYNIGYNKDTFSVAVRSGVIPGGLPDTGDIVLSHSKVYDLYPRSSYSRNRDRNNIFSFLKNPLLQSGIYDVIDLDGKDIYIYDFANSFDNVTTYDTGVLHRNYTAYNITDSKFSIWGRDFNGDIIPYPIRDRSVVFSDYDLSCASGRACLQISGVPNYFRVGDQFYIDFKVGIYPQSSDLLYCSGTLVQNEPMILADTPQDSGLIIGMNAFGTFGNYLNYGAYISGFVPYGPKTGIVLRNQTPFSYAPPEDQLFSFSRETSSQIAETTAVKNAVESHFSGPYRIENIIKPGVVSVTNYRPKFYYDPTDPMYDDWRVTQETRGVALWRNAGSTGVATLITGVENIQTDKDPNYNNKYMSLTNSISLGTTEDTTEDVLMFTTNGFPTGSLMLEDNTNLSHHHGFNVSLAKYLSDCSFSGIYKPYRGSGTISSSVYWPNASGWTVSPVQTTTKNTNLIIRDIDHFQIVSASYELGDTTAALTPTGVIASGYYVSGIPQNSGITFTFGLNGGLGLETAPPNVYLGLIDDGYTIEKTYISGIDTTLLNPSCVFGPTSNTWKIDLGVSGLNDIEFFDVEFEDFVDGKIRKRIYNIDGTGAHPQVVNFTDHVFYDYANSIPWVVSFDVENVGSDLAIGIQSTNTADVTVINSGISYTAGLNKWQGFLVGNSTATDAQYDIDFAITGEIPTIDYSDTLTLDSVNDVYTDRITNLPTGILHFDDGENITTYFNFQKPRFQVSSIQPYFTKPSAVNVFATKISTDYTDLTNRELYRLVVSNTGTAHYNLTTNFTYDNVTVYSDSTKVIIYNNLDIANIYLPFSRKFTDENWLMSFDVFGGNQVTPPDIKLLNAPSDYRYATTYDSDNAKWNVSVTGHQDILGRYGQTSGTYNISIFARDLTSYDEDSVELEYVCPPRLETVKPYYGVKDKSYFVNLDIKNCTDSFDPTYNLPSINNFLPSTQTKIYDKYNPLINKNEVRYSGDPLLEKWDARIDLTNINTEQEYDANPQYGYGQPTLTVKVRGLDDDLISVIGMLKLKELETFSTDYPPLEIVEVEPESEEELNQGEDWDLAFKVVGGLANGSYPPTIIISGLPTLEEGEISACSGYYPDENIDGLSCMRPKSFDTDTWSFVFTGISYCRTGVFPIAIKAFDITGEDTHDTSFIFKPLTPPGPSIAPKEIDYSLFPNCQSHYGVLQYSSSSRKSPCPYETGIVDVEILHGQLPAGLTWSDEGGLDLNGVGTGTIAIQGIPTEFPENNAYPAVTFQVTDAVGKTAKVNITYNTASIQAMDMSPVGATLYFPGSGYYESFDDQGNSKVDNATQKTFYPYPGTGLFNCRSILVDNDCPVQITGYYTKFSNSGLHVDFGYEQQTNIQDSHVFAVFDRDVDGLNNSYNNVYQLVQAGTKLVRNPAGFFVPSYTGVLTSHENLSVFSSIASAGKVDIVTFEVATKEAVGSLILKSKPEPVLHNDSCILGTGQLVQKENQGGQAGDYVLTGKMRPSMVATIGDKYPKPETNVNQWNGLPGLYLLSGVSLSTAPGFNEGEIHEFFFSNCYESGSTYLSGVILPMPILEITDPGTVRPQTSDGKQLSFATRCAFGAIDSQRAQPINQRSLSAKYYVKTLETNEYIQAEGNPINYSLSSDYVEYELDLDDGFDVNAITPNVGGTPSGCVYHVHMWRESDKFPTFDPDSYDYMEYDLYWVHDSRSYTSNNPDTSINQYSFPATQPVYFGSGITVMSGVPFEIDGEIIGGRTDGKAETPTITNLFVESSDLDTEVLNINNVSYDIGLYENEKRANGAWYARIMGVIENLPLSNSYLGRYVLKATIEENYTQDMNLEKTYTARIPVTILKPLSINIPVTNISVNYGSPWQLSFNVYGGNRPPVYYEDTINWVSNNTPTLEIDNDICDFYIYNKTYNRNSDSWNFIIKSTSGTINSTTYALSARDITGGFDSQSFNVSVNT